MQGVAKSIATEGGMERGQFEAELVEIQAKMAGWNNIFFCAQNVEVSDAMIEKLIKYDYRNHLAYIYVYAYDNKPEIVAKAYYSESQLIYFSKGSDWQQKLAIHSLFTMHTRRTLCWRLATVCIRLRCCIR